MVFHKETFSADALVARSLARDGAGRGRHGVAGRQVALDAALHGVDDPLDLGVAQGAAGGLMASASEQ